MNRRLFACSLVSAGVTRAFAPGPLVVKMGTLAPAGSAWHKVLLTIGERWRTISQGRVVLRIYPGGVSGDEPDMVRQMNINELQAVAITGAGMADIDQGIACLQIPMLFQSYDELDAVRDRLSARLEQRIEARGRLVLNWGDAGWVHFFTTREARRLDEMRKLKLFTWAGDSTALDLWRTNGFNVIPLAATDIPMMLRTHQLEAVPTTPLYAEMGRFYDYTKFMNDVKWAPLVGGTIIRKSAWEAIPAELRPQLLQAARDAGQELRGGIRKMGDDAVVAMQKRGLTVVSADAATIADWTRQAENIYPQLRGKTIPADLFDEARRLRDEYRSGRNATRKGGAN